MAIFTPILGGPVGGGLLPALPTISAHMLAINAAAGTIDWWSADTGVDTASWIGRKSYNRMVPLTGTDFPTETPAAYNGATAMETGTLSTTIGDLRDNGANLMPVNASYTLWWAGRRGNINAYLLGTDGASPGYVWHGTADNKIRVAQGGTVQITGTVVVPPTTPHYGVYSYDYAAKTARLRINGTDAGTKTGVAQENVNPRFQMFAYGNGGSTATGGSQLFAAGLTNTAVIQNDATLLGHIEAYLSALIGV